MGSAGLIALFIIVLLNTIFIAGIFLALVFLNRKLNELTTQVEPLTRRAGDTLEKVETLTGVVQRRAEIVLEQTEALVQRVARKVDTTTAIAEESISQPLIGAASLMAGLSRGLESYREQANEKGDNH